MRELTGDHKSRVQEQVDRILSSAIFSGSERHRRFLRFVVEQTLKGEPEKLNEFVLGFEVFDKNASFDPRIDSIVRVEARRLRERLRKYYQAEGQNDPVVITLRPRSFVPEFREPDHAEPVSPARFSTWVPAHKTIAVAGVALILGAIAGAVLFSLRDRRPPRPQTSSIVVLPFQTLTPIAPNEMLGDTIADSIITELASVPGLRVISRGSSLQFKDSGRTAAQFASGLQVDYVVEGTVQLKQGRVAVSAKLTDTHSGSYVWAQTQEAELKQLPEFERELSSAIASRIHLPFPPPGADHVTRRRAATLAAYSAFLKGQYFLYQWDSGGAEKSVALLEESVHGDPNYAPAWAWLSQAYLLLIYRDDGQDAAIISKGRQAALKALTLDAQLAEAQAAVASYAALDWDWKSAESGFRRAVELDPGWAQGHLLYARMFLIPNGRIQEATQEVLRAHELDPLTRFTRMSLAEVLYFNRDYTRSVAEYEDLRKPSSQANPPDGMYFMALSLQGQSKRAVSDMSQSLPTADRLSPAEALFGYLLAKAGDRTKAQTILASLLDAARLRYIPPVPLAMLSTGLDNRDEAFSQLRRAVTRHVPSVVHLGVDPVFDSLRSDPRYAAILGDIGLKTTK